jgi:hypothetical protein
VRERSRRHARATISGLIARLRVEGVGDEVIAAELAEAAKEIRARAATADLAEAEGPGS